MEKYLDFPGTIGVTRKSYQPESDDKAQFSGSPIAGTKPELPKLGKAKANGSELGAISASQASAIKEGLCVACW